MMMSIQLELKELIRQATEDRSHFYVKKVCISALDTINYYESILEEVNKYAKLGMPVERIHTYLERRVPRE